VAWPVNKQPEQAFTSNAAHAALIIPEHFGRDMARGLDSPVQLLMDASDANTAKLVAGYSGPDCPCLPQKQPVRPGPTPCRRPSGSGTTPAVRPRSFLRPAIFVLGLSMFPPLLASLAMAKEGEQKTILQVYVSSISAHEFLLGKILAFMAVAVAECLLMLIPLFTYFGLSFAGDPTPFVVATVLYAFCVAAFGTMVGAAIPNQVAAIQAISFGGFLLVFLLSGLMFPIDNIPAGIRWISNFVWGRYYIEIVRDALLEGGGWPATWFKVVIIGIIGVTFYLIAWRTMRRMQLST
jgi:ABC-2 type transport system permease protein